MRRQFINLTLPLCITLFLLTSCAENLPQDISNNYNAPYQHTFNVSYKDAWKGAVSTLNEKDRIKTIDKESGLIVTEYMTVNKKVLTMFQTLLFGRTYKNSYSITFNDSGPGRTSITVQSNLMMEQFGFYNRERNVDWFEAYLREDLFNRLCNAYYRNQSKCNQVFSSSQEQFSRFAEDTVPTNYEQEVVVTQTSEIQQALLNAGYNPGPVDGVWGMKTRTALEDFQRDRGIETSGNIDNATLNALNI